MAFCAFPSEQSTVPKFQNRASTEKRRYAPVFLCEGWAEKASTGRSFFHRDEWQRRYVFVTPAGLGYTSVNPRERSSYLADRHLPKSAATTFIPFCHRRHTGEIVLNSVYYIRDVSALQHPQVPSTPSSSARSALGSTRSSLRRSSATMTTCCHLERQSTKTTLSPSGSLDINSPLPSADVALHSEETVKLYYYTGVSFVEGGKRNLLVLRTTDASFYSVLVQCLPLFLHQGCTSNGGVPIAHPLERRSVDELSHQPWLKNREVPFRSPFLLFKDPDICTSSEGVTLHEACLSWDEGEQDRVVRPTMQKLRHLREFKLRRAGAAKCRAHGDRLSCATHSDASLRSRTNCTTTSAITNGETTCAAQSESSASAQDVRALSSSVKIVTVRSGAEAQPNPLHRHASDAPPSARRVHGTGREAAVLRTYAAQAREPIQPLNGPLAAGRSHYDLISDLNAHIESCGFVDENCSASFSRSNCSDAQMSGEDSNFSDISTHRINGYLAKEPGSRLTKSASGRRAIKESGE